jgi:hypothetical protein
VINTYADIEEGQTTFDLERERDADEARLTCTPNAFQFSNERSTPGELKLAPTVWFGAVRQVILCGDKDRNRRPTFIPPHISLSPFDYEEGIVDLFTITEEPPPVLRWSNYGAELTVSLGRVALEEVSLTYSSELEKG